MKMNDNLSKVTIITAGSNYLDIDAYACCIAMMELLLLQGINAIACSNAVTNYSICRSLVEKGQVLPTLPEKIQVEDAQYIIVDVSDPAYINETVPVEQVIEVYDHHVGFEDYWTSRIGGGTHIEFIGAAATLIYRKWRKSSLQDKMSRFTAKLLIAAILDNTLNLTSANTTQEDIEVFKELCAFASVDESWCAAYFSEVQANVETDLHNALLNDTKSIGDNAILPSHISQLAVWNPSSILGRLPEIREWFCGTNEWMLNIIDIQHRCSYFVCDDIAYQKNIEQVFNIQFEMGIAKTPIPYLRKEIIKKTQHNA